jgi:hypothetical protein
MPAGRPRIYNTEEERQEGLKVCYARYREKHREEIRERNRTWEADRKEQRNAAKRARYRELHPLPVAEPDAPAVSVETPQPQTV